jgi:cyclase
LHQVAVLGASLWALIHLEKMNCLPGRGDVIRKLRIPTAFFAFMMALYVTAKTNAAPQPADPGSENQTVTGQFYRFDRVAEGVYYATAAGTMITGGNHPVIINDHDVILVDSGTSPAAARALMADLRLVTDKPVRWVVNTHWHYDHVDGNSIFGPEVEIVGHEYVRHALLDLDLFPKEIDWKLTDMREQSELLQKQVQAEKDPAKRRALQEQLNAMQSTMAELKEIKPVPPTTTFASKMTIFRGQREIQLLFLGRGHTGGDTVVFLPKERIVCTGDLMETKPSSLSSGYFDEWITTLDQLKKLDFDIVLPGHGTPFHGTALITAFQGYLKDVVDQVSKYRKQGLTPEETAKKVDLTSHKSDFPQIQGPGIDLVGARRIYQWLDETGK